MHLHSTLVVRVVVTGDNQATGSDWPELDVLLNQTQASFFYNNVFVSWWESQMENSNKIVFGWWTYGSESEKESAMLGTKLIFRNWCLRRAKADGLPLAITFCKIRLKTQKLNKWPHSFRAKKFFHCGHFFCRSDHFFDSKQKAKSFESRRDNRDKWDDGGDFLKWYLRRKRREWLIDENT